jgi:pantoate--beta-alanine ligase
MQFSIGEDFDQYPRTPKDDRAALQALDVDLLFMPEVEAMYPRPLSEVTFVEVPGLSDILCGAHRPEHFRGVATVVNRLFNMVQPEVAVFGKKDYQQLAVIRRMVSDLAMPLEIVGAETVREADNLAMSSRNRYLSDAERNIAPTLYATLDSIRSLIISVGEIPLDIEQQAMTRLKSAGFRPDYVSIRRQLDLAAAAPDDTKLVILAAAWLGKTRLIDNLEFELNPEA